MWGKEQNNEEQEGKRVSVSVKISLQPTCLSRSSRELSLSRELSVLREPRELSLSRKLSVFREPRELSFSPDPVSPGTF